MLNLAVTMVVKLFPVTLTDIRFAIKKEYNVDIPESNISCYEEIKEYGLYHIRVLFCEYHILKLWVIKDFDILNESQQKGVTNCCCTVKATDVQNLYLLYVQRSCPIHGDKWKA